MMTWISESIFRIFSWIPNWLYADDSPRYLVVRGMLGLLLIVGIILAVVACREVLRRRRIDHNAKSGARD